MSASHGRSDGGAFRCGCVFLSSNPSVTRVRDCAILRSQGEVNPFILPGVPSRARQSCFHFLVFNSELHQGRSEHVHVSSISELQAGAAIHLK
jgi:hypothetical protein